jgi:hypothetical protein
VKYVTTNQKYKTTSIQKAKTTIITSQKAKTTIVNQNCTSSQNYTTSNQYKIPARQEYNTINPSCITMSHHWTKSLPKMHHKWHYNLWSTNKTSNRRMSHSKLSSNRKR